MFPVPSFSLLPDPLLRQLDMLLQPANDAGHRGSGASLGRVDRESPCLEIVIGISRERFRPNRAEALPHVRRGEWRARQSIEERHKVFLRDPARCCRVNELVAVTFPLRPNRACPIDGRDYLSRTFVKVVRVVDVPEGGAPHILRERRSRGVGSIICHCAVRSGWQRQFTNEHAEARRPRHQCSRAPRLRSRYGSAIGTRHASAPSAVPHAYHPWRFADSISTASSSGPRPPGLSTTGPVAGGSSERRRPPQRISELRALRRPRGHLAIGDGQ